MQRHLPDSVYIINLICDSGLFVSLTDGWEEHFAPKPGEKVFEIGAGSVFPLQISKDIQSNCHLYLLDPSLEQLRPIVEKNI